MESVIRLLGITITFVCLIVIVFSPTIFDHRCLIDMPSFLEDVFRKSTDCTFCDKLDTIPRLKNVQVEKFVYEYAYRGIPVVVEDATENWTATKTFDVDFFFNLYDDKLDSNCQFFKYKTNFSSLQEALNSIKLGSVEMWYIGWSNCDGEIADILRQHYNRPYFLPDESESASTDWIFMGMPGYGAQKHVDYVKYPSWQAQVKGSKLWILYPPPECYYTCDKMKYDVILEPGDTIVVDTNLWYHETHVISNDISISIGSEFD